MVLVSIAPGEPYQVRVYSCARGSKLRNRLIDTKFNRTLDAVEVADLQKYPEAFVARATEPEVA